MKTFLLNIMYVSLLAFMMLGQVFTACAQDKAPFKYKKDYWGDIPGYIEAQSWYSLNIADKLLKKVPPFLGPSIDRDAALTILDQVTHLPDAFHVVALQNFYHERIAALLPLLNSKLPATAKAVIYKLYNHGFIVRTKYATYAFDVVRGPGNNSFALNDSLTEAIIKHCDVLFISHLHGDHADEFVARTFLKLGKPVITPDSVWSNKEFYRDIQHPVRDVKQLHSLKLQNGNTVSFAALPGHQSKSILNNIYLIKDPSNFCFAQTGDQSNEADFEWMDDVHRNFKIDILLPNCWSLNLPRLIKGFDPKLVIPGHNNELGHTVDHREPYWINDMRAENYSNKAINITWGEVYEYQ